MEQATNDGVFIPGNCAAGRSGTSFCNILGSAEAMTEYNPDDGWERVTQ
jgi:hypothetical protein